MFLCFYGMLKQTNSQVFLILDIAVEKLFDFGVEGGEPLFLLSVGEVDTHVGSGRHDVELRVKHIDTMDNSVEPGESESSVTLVLSNSVLATTENQTSKQIAIQFIQRLKKDNKKQRTNIRKKSKGFITFQQSLGRYW